MPPLRPASGLILAILLNQPGFAAPPATVPANIPAAPTLTTPAGDYTSAWLTLTGGPAPVTAFLAMRDGKPVQFWSTSVAFPGMPATRGSPKLLTDALRGVTTNDKTSAEIDLRLVSIWAPQARIGTTTLSLSFTAADGKLSGTWSTTGNAASGKLTGSILTESAAKAAHAIAPGQDWPSFYGALSALRAPAYNKPLIDDLAKARPLWRSEAVSLSGWGTGVDSRYKTRAAYGTLCGGSSSPVVANGILYLYHYRPTEPDPADIDAPTVEKFQDNAHEFGAMRRYFSRRADVVVTAIDAATGKTVWESTWPNKQGNYQTHKWRANNPTPAVAGNTLVVIDYSWGVHAFDAATGSLKWTRGGGGPVPHDQGAVGPVISGNVVIFTTAAATFGLDLATGKELWKAPGAASARRMVLDGRQKEERVLLVGPTLTLIDPATGKTIASAPFPGGVENKGKKDLGRGIGDNLVCDGPYIVSFETVVPDIAADPRDAAATAPATVPATLPAPPAPKRVGNIFAMKVEGDKIVPAWTNKTSAAMEDGHTGITIANGYVYTAFQSRGAFCIELATGKTVKQVNEANAHSNPIFVTVDNRILWQPECQHGRQVIQLFDTGPHFGPLGAPWKPPHNDTTAYGEMPIANVTVDGRLFLRGMDGIYCYDLRK